ncbi:MAG: type ISP restriction/modification enzyme [Sporichthyaceae bacterium]
MSAIRSPAGLARRMAEVAREVRNRLAPDPLADGYAQTAVYGLLVARLVGSDGFGAAVPTIDRTPLDELAAELAAADLDGLLADFGADSQRGDPVVYFYEEFLAAYDPEQRQKLGAVYTPLPVVRYIVKTVDDALTSFGLPLGVADSTTWVEYVGARPGLEIPAGARPDGAVVSMFDPAAGTGTFLVEWLRRGRRNAGEAGAAAALRHASTGEISPAAHAVSLLRVALELAEAPPSLPIHLGDTLGSVDCQGRYNVLIGNPPYDRVESSGTGGTVTAVPAGGGRSLFDDIVDDAKQHTIFSHHASLYNLYVYFWRWAIWKVFEQNTGPAVVSMITASSWLDGPGFLGLRRLAREVADEIVVVDLHGDNKGTRKDENVFDVESPVAVVTLVRRGTGDRATPARVRYASYRGTRAEKLAALTDLAAGTAEVAAVEAASGWHASFVPSAGGADWERYPAVVDLLPFQMPGCKFNRTWPIGPAAEVLERRWARFVATADVADRERCFVTGSGRNIHTKVAGFEKLADEPVGAPNPPIVGYGYRSFDRQWALRDPRLAALERPALWASLSDRQVFLLTKPTFRLGLGPAAVVSVGVPDLDHFRGSFGGKDVVPLYRDAMGTPNADPTLLAALTATHRAVDPAAPSVTVERLFAYVFGILAGTDYTQRFHDALETPGPRIPVAADPVLFEAMAAHGERLVWLQTFGERFGSGAIPTTGIEWSSEPTRLPQGRADVAYDRATETLRVADGLLIGVPGEVWDFSVSGMQVLAKWLGYRTAKPAGRAASSESPLDRTRPATWSPDWNVELVEIVAVLRATLALLPEGNALLDQIVAGPLVAADELPAPPDALRQPPSGKAGQGGATLLAEA